MKFKHACFVSYCHGRYDLVKGFIDQLTTALKAELDPLMDEELYIDEERMKPGYQYNEELAQAMCQSLCMVLVYSPRYAQHEYCVREFEGMELLQQKRLELLGPLADGTLGFIIPVLLRGDVDEMPEPIRKHKHYADFSRFSLATPDLLHNAEYLTDIRKIVAVIYAQYRLFAKASSDPCALCTGFRLPAASKVAAWKPPFVNR